jgi:hypothetical protein
MELTVRQVKPLVSDGKIFKCVFRKRTDGTERVMYCRTGVKKDQTGEGLAFKPDEYNLISVYDMEKKAYRFISLDDIRELHFHGEAHFFA